MKNWYARLAGKGYTAKIPQIADYELRRELILIQSLESIAELNRLIRETNGLVPITTDVWARAAELWAECRRPGGRGGTCDPKKLDADMILCATADLLTSAENEVVVATTNVKHLEDFVTAKLWQDIQ